MGGKGKGKGGKGYRPKGSKGGFKGKGKSKEAHAAEEDDRGSQYSERSQWSQTGSQWAYLAGEDDWPEGEAFAAEDWQGSDWQGSDWQGSDWRGSGWQDHEAYTTEAERQELNEAAARVGGPQPVWPEEPPPPPQQPPTTNTTANNSWRENAATDRNVPKLHGKTAREFREYIREVGFWELETPLSEERRGPALIRQLSGRAADLTKHLMPADVFVKQGVQIILKALESLEKEPDIKLEEMADAFFTLNRRPQETHDEFLGRADSVRKDLKKEDLQFDCNDGFWCLYILRRAGITAPQRAQLLVMTAGKYIKDEIYRALRTLGPLFDRARGAGATVADGAARQQQTGKKPWFNKKPQQAYVAEPAIPEEPEEEEEASNEDEEAFEAEEDSEEDREPVVESFPAELKQELVEAMAAYQSAKARMTTAKKARGFFQGVPPGTTATKPQPPEKIAAMKVLKARTKCHDYDKMGHWSGDKECEKRKNSTPGKKAQGVHFCEAFSAEEVRAQGLLSEQSEPPTPHSHKTTKRGTRGGKADKATAAFHVQDNHNHNHHSKGVPVHFVGTVDLETFVQVQTGDTVSETSGAGILDSGCQKIVCGHLWLEQNISCMNARGIDLQVNYVPENRRFRFGNHGCSRVNGVQPFELQSKAVLARSRLQLFKATLHCCSADLP